MRHSFSDFILKIYFITLVIGVALGDLIVYLNDRYQHLPYDSNWDNPFLDFIFFLLIGIGESIIPVIIFFLIAKIIIRVRIAYKRALIYTLGFLCTVFPFVTLYNMVDPGYHRYNVCIYALSCVIALTLSNWWTRADLNKLIHDSSQER